MCEAETLAKGPRRAMLIKDLFKGQGKYPGCQHTEAAASLHPLDCLSPWTPLQCLLCSVGYSVDAVDYEEEGPVSRLALPSPAQKLCLIVPHQAPRAPGASMQADCPG